MKNNDVYLAIIEIRFHLGEMYFILPFLNSLPANEKSKICLLFTKEKLFNQFVKDEFLSSIVKADRYVISKIFSDEIDDLRSQEETEEIRERVRIQKRRLTRLLSRSDYYFVQIGGGFGERIIRGRCMERPFVARFPHSSGPMLFPRGESVVKQRGSGKDPVLTLDPLSSSYYYDAGMPMTIPLGYHCLTAQWRNLAAKAAQKIPSCAVVYSFQKRNDILPEKQWLDLHQWSYDVIRKYYGDLPIYIKSHPNQDFDELVSLAAEKGWLNTNITTENPTVLAEKAEICLSFLTFGIFSALLLDVPSINVFNAKSTYEENFGPMKQDYPSIGVPTAATYDELDELVKRISNGEIKTDFGKTKSKIPRINNIKEVTDKVRDWYAECS